MVSTLTLEQLKPSTLTLLLITAPCPSLSLSDFPTSFSGKSRRKIPTTKLFLFPYLSVSKTHILLFKFNHTSLAYQWAFYERLSILSANWDLWLSRFRRNSCISFLGFLWILKLFVLELCKLTKFGVLEIKVMKEHETGVFDYFNWKKEVYINKEGFRASSFFYYYYLNQAQRISLSL